MTLRCLALLLFLSPLMLSALPATATVPASKPGIAAASAVHAQTLAAEGGDASAMAALGWRHYYGDGVAEDNDQALKWFRAAADKGSLAGLHGLASCLRYGYGAPRDVAAADKMLLAAAQGGHAPAQATAAALAIDDGKLELARAWYDKAAAQGNVVAQRGLGWMLLYGKGGPKDGARGLALLRTAIDAGDAGAMNALGEAYLTGAAGKVDGMQARDWFGRSAATGNARGRMLLGVLLQTNVGGPAAPDEALRLFRLAADDGDANAAFMLAKSYGEDSHNPDPVQALRWRLRAIELGHADPDAVDALAQLGGELLLRGRQDLAATAFARSIELVSASGASGEALAQHYLALGSGYSIADRFAEAENYRRRAVTLMRGVPDADPAKLANAFHYLGFTLNSRGQYEEARQLLEQAVATLDSQVSKKSVKLINPLQSLGDSYLALGQTDLAEAAWRRRLALCESNSIVGAWRAAALSDLALLYTRTGRQADAERMLEKALAQRKDPEGRPSFTTAVALHRQAIVYRDIGRAREAEAQFERALAAISSIPASAGWDTAEVMHDFGIALLQQGQTERAAAMLEEAFTLRLAAQPTHHWTRESANALVSLYRAGGNETAAAQIEQRLGAAAAQPAQPEAGATMQAR